MALGLDYIDQAHILLSWKELYLCISNLCLIMCNIIVEQVQVFASLKIELSPQKNIKHTTKCAVDLTK